MKDNHQDTKPQSFYEDDCPDCYGGHFRPCQLCGDTGRVTFVTETTSTTAPSLVVQSFYGVQK